MKLYRKSYWVYTVTDFIGYLPLFTMLLLFYVFDVGKTKIATQSVLIMLTLNWAIPKNFLGFLFYPLEIPDKTRLHP